VGRRGGAAAAPAGQPAGTLEHLVRRRLDRLRVPRGRPEVGTGGGLAAAAARARPAARRLRAADDASRPAQLAPGVRRSPPRATTAGAARVSLPRVLRARAARRTRGARRLLVVRREPRRADRLQARGPRRRTAAARLG